ncbi:alpha/beta hydrolase family protein [Labilibaculum euxinus]|uniref:Prolyl oligopeptidase family serine peptidase n=1 Tax=Labilibaculum euxinus TaxID=2686357 RepID=A0A7M4D6A0_9BACT|nr:prolyl oligopeptidase family serine peptidase [Labilibaculum euxinus]MUP38179.1 prolyl oligopeptidase family serine peptidase [Labilibaculum euxinus]MVB07384.1 prolyl oligopeptidase family serine peptidase [Labilibaculum euxinus]
MKRNYLILFALLFVLAACQPKKKVVEIPSYSIEQFYKNTNVSGGSFSSDGSKLLVSSNETGIYNLFEIPVDGSPAKQLTNSEKESFFGLAYFPNSDKVLLSYDQGGNENNHIYMRDVDGTITDLTPFEGARAGFWGWDRDEKSFYYQSNKRNPKFMDLYQLSLESIEKGDFAAKLLYENNDGLDVASKSKDNRYLALTQSITTNNNEMYLYDRKSGKKMHISEHSGDATYNPQFFSLDGKYLYYLSNEDSDFVYLNKYDIESGEKEMVFKADWDVWYAYDSYNEKYRIIGINEDGKTNVKMIDLATNEEVKLPDIKGGDIKSVGLTKDENRVRLVVGTSVSPNNIYVFELGDTEAKKLTETLNPEIDPANLVEAKVIRYESFDGVQIPAIYYQPKIAATDRKVPAVVWVHGGPGGQSRVSYFSLIQFMVNHGYAVLAVNNRGSSGYGKKFYAMDDKKHGDEDLKDCIWGKKFLASTGVVDESKIGIIGGSYGGYMTMAALTFAPEEFEVGVNIFGVTNWLRTLKSIPPYWESFRNALYAEIGDPTTIDSVALYNKSPLFFADKVTKPLMVLQGANDVRVLKAESDEIVEAVKKNGVPVEYIVFDDEGHGFRKKENEIKGYGQVVVFLDKYLKKEEVPVAE